MECISRGIDYLHDRADRAIIGWKPGELSGCIFFFSGLWLYNHGRSLDICEGRYPKQAIRTRRHFGLIDVLIH